MEFVLLLLGLVALWIGAELAISGAIEVAERYKISKAFLGLTVLALGTDLPELFINVTAALQKLGGVETSNLIIGGIIGTTVSQISLIFGIAALFGTMSVVRRHIARDGLFMIVSVILLFFAGMDGELSRFDGGIFILLYIVYFITIIREEKLREKFRFIKKQNLLWAVISMMGGFIILIIGSKWTIDNALLISQNWGIAQSIIGILVVGLGTSLPELATSITAVRRGAGRMAVGNLVGSNIFDMLFTLGIGAAISTFSVKQDLLFTDVPFLLILSITVVVLLATKLRINKKEAGFLIAIYVLYFAWKVSSIM